MATSLCAPTYSFKLNFYTAHSHRLNAKSSLHYRRRFGTTTTIFCSSSNLNDDNNQQQRPQSEAIQVYSQIERFFPVYLKISFFLFFFCMLPDGRSSILLYDALDSVLYTHQGFIYG